MSDETFSPEQVREMKAMLRFMHEDTGPSAESVRRAAETRAMLAKADQSARDGIKVDYSTWTGDQIRAAADEASQDHMNRLATEQHPVNEFTNMSGDQILAMSAASKNGGNVAQGLGDADMAAAAAKFLASPDEGDPNDLTDPSGYSTKDWDHDSE